METQNTDNRETVIQVDHVSKKYRLGVIGSTTLRADIQTRWAKLRGKEDPNSIIGQENVKKGILYAVDDVSLTVKKGECLGIIGRNGAGKSTLLKLICRITAPTEGTIAIKGKVTSMLEVGTGFHPELTGRENIFMNGSILGMSSEEIAAKIDDIVRFAEVEDFVDTPVKRYSSGMYVRLAFAVSAHLNADIVIMDEVLAVGDMNFQEKCIRRMRQIAEEDHKTILYVSHNMNTIHALCDRCIVLQDGGVVYDGDVAHAEQIYRSDLKGNLHLDYSDEKSHWFAQSTGDIKVLESRYPNEDSSVVRDTLDVIMRWKYVREVNGDHCMRIEIRDAMGRIIASRLFENIPGGSAGEEREETFSVDIRMLQNGYYTTTYVFPQMASNRTFITLDLVDGLPCTIDDPERDKPTVWRSEWWGKIRL